MSRRNSVVLVLAGLLAACAAVPGGTSAPKITTGPLSWKITQLEYSFSATGTAPVQLSDSTHAYLLVYRVYWARKLDASGPADTVSTIALVVPGVSKSQSVEIADTETRCTTYTTVKRS